MKKTYLMTPGPTPIPPSVLLSMAQPIIHHRTEEFEQVFAEVRQGLKYLFQTEADVLSICSSGTGAMEAAVVNLLSPGDRVITVNGGKFGQRWTQICQSYGVSVDELFVKRGQPVDPDVVASRLANGDRYSAVFTTFSETSTGVAHDIGALAKIVSAYPETVLVVDAITALGVIDIPMDDWRIDVLVTGSQKALMLPPGLAFIALSDKAWGKVENSRLPKYYFDLKKELKMQQKNQSAYTPAISLLIGLREVLKMIREERLECLFLRHKTLAKALREAICALGLDLFAPTSPSDALTAVKVPDGIDGKKLVKHMSQKYGVTIAGGQDELKGNIFRIAHLGYLGHFDLITAVSALEMTLRDLGHPVTLGKGVAAAQDILG